MLVEPYVSLKNILTFDLVFWTPRWTSIFPSHFLCIFSQVLTMQVCSMLTNAFVTIHTVANRRMKANATSSAQVTSHRSVVEDGGTQYGLTTTPHKLTASKYKSCLKFLRARAPRTKPP